MTSRRIALLSSALLSCACAPADDGERLATAVTGTLPGGIATVQSAGPTAWTDTTGGWRLVPDGQLDGDVGSLGEFVDPVDLAIDERGWVYVVDSKPPVVKVYDDSGRFVRSFGRDGQGPGEFRIGFIAVRNGTVLLHDPRNSRTSVFDTSGAFVRSWVSACCYWLRPNLDARGRAAIPAMASGDIDASQLFIRYDTLGTLLDTVFVPKMPSGPLWIFRRGELTVMSTVVPFAPGGDVAFTPAGALVHGWSGAFSLVVSENGRDTSRVFGRAWTAERIDDARRDAEYARRTGSIAKEMEIDTAAVQVQFERDKIPLTLPAFSGISVDARGNTWVHLDEERTLTRFDVFGPSGAYLGRVHAPLLVRKFTSAWGRDVMYVRHDTEEGYPRIRRFRITRDR